MTLIQQIAAERDQLAAKFNPSQKDVEMIAYLNNLLSNPNQI